MDISLIAKKIPTKSYMTCHKGPRSCTWERSPDHAYFIPFSKEQNAFAEREQSQRFGLLNGDWDFSYYDSIIDMPDHFITQECGKTKLHLAERHTEIP